MLALNIFEILLYARKFSWKTEFKFYGCQIDAKLIYKNPLIYGVFTEDNFLLSSENLPSSPELWPEKVPGSDNFSKTAHKNARENDNGLTQEDIRMIYRK